MKMINLDERIHVPDAESSALSVLEAIINSGVQEEAFYIGDIGDIVLKYRLFKAAMPRVTPFYAVKCNETRTVLETLAALGTGFDCASNTEIDRVLELGVDSTRIIFANPAKYASHIQHAAATGVELMTFDNEAELYKIQELFPNAKMVLRIRSDATISKFPLGAKFGCDPITEAPELLDLAQSLGINVVGVSFHVGSGCGEPAAFHRAISASRKVFDYAETVGYNLHILDVGGGYPGGHGQSIQVFADVINKALEVFFPDPAVQVIAEPGQYFVSSAYTLACRIHSIRNISTIDENTGACSKHVNYYINDGVFGSFNCVLYNRLHVDPIPLKVKAGAKSYNSTIWGPTCDSTDRVLENHVMPEMKIDDWLVFEDMGSYTLPLISRFNGFLIPKVHLIADKNNWLVLKDMSPLTENHFVIGNTPANLRLGLDIGTSDTSPSINHTTVL